VSEVPRPGAPLVPENAPFDEEQRAWLNGFLAGVLGIVANEAGTAVQARPTESAAPSAEPAPTGASSEREQRLFSALARLDCGKCGYSCHGYARALAVGAEKDTGLCTPGGGTTREALEAALVEPARLVRGGRSPSGVVLRPSRRELEIDSTASSVEGAGGSDERRLAERLRVKGQRRLTLADAGSEVREVVLDLAGTALRYRAGDTLAVFPHNDPELVRHLLRALGARGQELVKSTSGPSEIWRCLLENVDVTHVREETLRLFASAATDTDALRGLGELLERGVPSGFDLLDLLEAFPSVRPGLEQVVATLAELEPRLYAIASSPSSHPTEVHLAVRMLRRERTGRERKGVASTFLTEGVIKGDDVLGWVRAGEHGAAVETSSPLILLGAGTGIARHRALLEELEARGRRGNTWLILASCCEGDETLYEADLKGWSKLGVLEHLDIIKLGQRGRRLGPHDILRRRARRVASWLDRGAFVYACGEGKAFSGLLTDTLVELLGRQGKMSASEAADFLHGLRREGRFVEEVY
jgi:sulfite reductase (NADPH) flavoprotein alpha-component